MVMSDAWSGGSDGSDESEREAITPAVFAVIVALVLERLALKPSREQVQRRVSVVVEWTHAVVV